MFNKFLMKIILKIHLKESKDPPKTKDIDAHVGAIGEKKQMYIKKKRKANTSE